MIRKLYSNSDNGSIVKIVGTRPTVNTAATLTTNSGVF